MEYQAGDWIELIKILAAYSLLIFGVGSILFRPVLRSKSFSYRILFYIIVMNILDIYLVFLLFFLQIEGKWSFILATVLLYAGSRLYGKRKTWKTEFKTRLDRLRDVLSGEYGKRIIVYNLRHRWKRALGGGIKAYIQKNMKGRWLELLLVAACFVFSFWYDAYHAIHFGGIGAPDVSVHTEWIQYMRQGNIFSDGVYPYGFHCIVYLLPTVFGLDIIPVMRFFGIVQYLFILLVLYLFLKKVFTAKGPAIFGLIVFCFFDIYNVEATMRYQFSLPQEFGMLGLYPAAYYLWMFLEERKKELSRLTIASTKTDRKETKKRIRKENRKLKLHMSMTGSWSYAWLFGLSICLTFAAHFYVTIVAFFLCLGVAAVYWFRIWRRNYLLPLIITGSLCMALAVFPLVVGVMAGKGLQASIGWAVGVMQDSGKEEKPPDTDTGDGGMGTETGGETGEGTGGEAVQPVPEQKPLSERIREKFTFIFYQVALMFTSSFVADVIFFFMALLLFAGLFTFFRYILPGTRPENRFQLGIFIYFMFLIVLAVPQIFSMPTLMELARVRIFIVYACPFIFGLPFELLCELAGKFRLTRAVMRWLMYAANGALIGYILYTGQLRELNYYYLLQYGGALRTTEHIMKEYEDQTWTIVSPVDETTYIRLNGFHYEWIDFLQAQEEWEKGVYIPTHYVFFYIEKQPLVYSDPVYMDAGMPEYEAVSREMAQRKLLNDISPRSQIYVQQRLVAESKAYYWAEAYFKYFPQEMEIYYEDDHFICYRLVQDDYYLNNLGIDYGYNLGEDWEQ